jgi:hypothetical protein
MMLTCHPDAIRWRAMAWPMPFAPPVIRATGFAVDMLWLFGRSIAFDGKVGASAPFRPGTVVETF